MKMIIVSRIASKQIKIDNPVFVPRKGERVADFFSPPPMVTEVVYNYTNNEVTVVCE